MPPPYTEVTIAALPTIAVDGSADLVEVYDASTASSGKATVRALVQTAPAALTDVANVFTSSQTIAAASGPSSLSLSGSDNGASYGPLVSIGRNTNASTPAAGWLQIVDKGNQPYTVWPDDTGVMRIATVNPTSANDLAGTVIGSQTSHESFKTVEGERLPVAELYAALAAAAPHVARFTYTIEREVYGEAAEVYEGIILKEDAPETHRYGTDKSQEGYRAGKSLNTITAIGDLVRVVVDLARRVYELENKAP